MKRLTPFAAFVQIAIIPLLLLFACAAGQDKPEPTQQPGPTIAKVEQSEQIALTNRELRDLLRSPSLNTLLKARDIRLGLKLKLFLIVKELKGIARTVEKVRREIMIEYAKLDAKGKRIVINDEYVYGEHDQEVRDKITELLDEPVDISKSKIVIKLSDLPRDLLSVEDLVTLSVLIEFKEK